MPDNEAGWMKAIADATTNVPSGVADSGNPTKIGGVAEALGVVSAGSALTRLSREEARNL